MSFKNVKDKLKEFKEELNFKVELFLIRIKILIHKILIRIRNNSTLKFNSSLNSFDLSFTFLKLIILVLLYLNFFFLIWCS
jgi:hypothetical protein